MAKFRGVKEFLDWLSHGKLVVDIVAAVFSAKGIRAVLTLTKIPPVWVSPIEWLGALIVLILMMRYGTNLLRSNKKEQTGLPESRTNALMRSASYEHGKFDSKEFFRIAYYSVLQDEVANNVRREADQTRPSDKESFYLDVISVGIIAYGYDSIWWPIFRSQLLALLALNKANGFSPLSVFRDFYNEAAKAHPSQYANFTFEQWMHYLENNILLKVHPSDMVEITVKGKDFLKYLLHRGLSADSKRL